VMNRVREHREAFGMSPERLASASGLDVRTVERVEGGRNCQQDTKRRLVVGLGFKWPDREHVFPREGEAMTSEGRAMTNGEAYRKGFEDGLKCFAWWKDGVQYVGTCGTTLRDALRQIRTLWGYDPPEEG